MKNRLLVPFILVFIIFGCKKSADQSTKSQVPKSTPTINQNMVQAKSLLASGNVQEGLGKLQSEAKNGTVGAGYILMKTYIHGIGHPEEEDQYLLQPNIKQAKSWALWLSKTSLARGVKPEALIHEELKEFFLRVTKTLNPTGLLAIERLAGQGYPLAEVLAGTLHEKGYFGREDLPKAARYYEDAALGGDAFGQLKWGEYLVKQQRSNQEVKKGYAFYLKAAQQDHALAQFYLGRYYFAQGKFAKAASWYNQSATNGYPVAQNQLGDMFLYGKGIKKNTKSAIYWYQRAAEQGFFQSQYQLAKLYQMGELVPQDKAKALEWYYIAERREIRHPTSKGQSYISEKEAIISEMPNEKIEAIEMKAKSFKPKLELIPPFY